MFFGALIFSKLLNSFGRGGGKYGPLHACCLFGRGNPHAAENLMLLLEHRADVKRRAVVSGMLAKEVKGELLCICYYEGNK